MKKTLLRPRGCAVPAAALLCLAALACGGPRASGKAAPRALGTDATRVPSAAGAVPSGGDTREPGPALPIQARPVVLVMPSGDAHLVLGAGPAPRSGGDAWTVVYLAAEDPSALGRMETRSRLASVASDLAAAFRPLAELAKAERLSVAALLGKPGASGVVEQRCYARDAGRWRADGAPRQYAVEQVPEIDAKVVRDREEEAAVRDAAAEFMSYAGRADYDAAWARTSAFVKATMSRAEFDRYLASFRAVDPASDAGLYLSFPAAERFVPGSFMEVWLERDAVDGAGVQSLTLRLDDDMQWRVAGVVDVSLAPPPAVLASPGETPVGT